MYRHDTQPPPKIGHSYLKNKRNAEQTYSRVFDQRMMCKLRKTHPTRIDRTLTLTLFYQ